MLNDSVTSGRVRAIAIRAVGLEELMQNVHQFPAVVFFVLHE